MNKIAIVIPYFGKWPDWFDLFLYSCERNEDINFILFTDCETPTRNYKNIEFISQSFTSYCKMVSEKLNVDFYPAKPYKLCDLKPFYGFLHQDILTEYDFWGFADIDIVFGDINSFYPNDLLEKYDVFSTHADRLSGHFCFFRNNEYFRNLCFQITKWEEKLSDETNYALDESDYSRLIFPESKFIGKFYRQIMMRIFNWKQAWEIYYSIFPVIQKILRFKKRKLYFKEQHTTPILASDNRMYKYESENWFYKDGKIYNDKIKFNYIYLHFMVFKKNNFRKDYFWKDNYYKLSKNHDFSIGVKISKTGFESL